MARKPPPLHLVDQTTTGNSPPRKLDRHGQILWDAITSEYRIDDRGGIELLAQACAAVDRAEALAACVNEDGATVRTKNGLRSHPCIKDELACRAFIVRTLQRLGDDCQE